MFDARNAASCAKLSAVARWVERGGEGVESSKEGKGGQGGGGLSASTSDEAVDGQAAGKVWPFFFWDGHRAWTGLPSRVKLTQEGFCKVEEFS